MHYREGGGLGSADAAKCSLPNMGWEAAQTPLDFMEDLCTCNSVSCCCDPSAESPLAASSPVLVTCLSSAGLWSCVTFCRSHPPALPGFFHLLLALFLVHCLHHPEVQKEQATAALWNPSSCFSVIASPTALSLPITHIWKPGCWPPGVCFPWRLSDLQLRSEFFEAKVPALFPILGFHYKLVIGLPCVILVALGT